MTPFGIHFALIAPISQGHLQRQFNELILVRVAGYGEGPEDLREEMEP
jgi:hypothetical protein